MPVPLRRVSRTSSRGARVSGRVLLVAGAGDVGGRVAALRQACGDDVVLLRRRAVDAPEGQRTLRADLLTGEGFAALPPRVDAVVFCPAPDRRDEAAYDALFVDGLRRLADAVVAARWLFVSSTAVYGEDAGEWVDESTPPHPPAFNGRVLLAAETIARDLPGGGVLRLSGLYGPGRDRMRRRARDGDPGERRWSNRIHVDDAASAAAHLLALAAPQPLYLGSDDTPVREHDLLAGLRAAEGLPPVPAPDGPDTGRRVRNTRLRASGWVPRHPDWRSGYGAGPGV